MLQKIVGKMHELDEKEDELYEKGLRPNEKLKLYVKII